MKKYIIFTAILAFFLVSLFTYYAYTNNQSQNAPTELPKIYLEDGTEVNPDGSTVIEVEIDETGLPDAPVAVFYIDGVRHEAYEMTPELQAIIDGLDESNRTRESGFEIVFDETEIAAGLTIGEVRSRLNKSSTLAEGTLITPEGDEMGTAKIGVDSEYVFARARAPLPDLPINDDSTSAPSYNVWAYVFISSVGDVYFNLGPMWQHGPEDFEFLTAMDKELSSADFNSVFITKEDSYIESDTPDLSRVVARVDF